MVHRNPKVRGAKSSGTAWNGPSQITSKKAKKSAGINKVKLTGGNIKQPKQPRVSVKAKKNDKAYRILRTLASGKAIPTGKIKKVDTGEVDPTTNQPIIKSAFIMRKATLEEIDKRVKRSLRNPDGVRFARVAATKDWGISAGKNINKKQTNKINLQTPSFVSPVIRNPRIHSGRVDPATAELRSFQIRKDPTATKYDIIGKASDGSNKYSSLSLDKQIKVLRGQRRII